MDEEIINFRHIYNEYYATLLHGGFIDHQQNNNNLWREDIVERIRRDGNITIPAGVTNYIEEKKVRDLEHNYRVEGIQGLMQDGKVRTSRKELYDYYRQWCKDNYPSQEKTLSYTKFKDFVKKYKIIIPTRE